MISDQNRLTMAIHDFNDARQRAAVQEILARVTGRSAQLLSYEEVAAKLKLQIRNERGLKNIPLDSIVGSVGRYTDFTRTFLPRRDDDRHRWAGVKTAMQSSEGLPPIEVYQVGEVYFVVDGNHRVSIARQENYKTIEAHVIEFTSDVNLTPDMHPDDLVIKAEYVEFLDATRIDEARPNVDLNVTAPNQYQKLMDQIHASQILLQEKTGHEIPLQDAAAAWYDTMYIPLAEAIRDRGLLRWFPERTITDLYIWISENRAALEKELGWQIQSDVAVTDLVMERSVTSETGSWRKARTVNRYTEQLFKDILVPLRGDALSWNSLEQALVIAKREEANIHGLHIVDTKEKLESPDVLEIQTRFDQKCAEAGVNGRLVIEAGDITKKICERATLNDLIVLQITHPPLSGLGTLRSSFRTILTNACRPVLGIPQGATTLQHALLAYDGSPRAKEALFVATYAAEMWKTKLTVLTALEGNRVTSNMLDHVRQYLEIHEVEAEYIVSKNGTSEALIHAVEERQIDLVLMGSHGGSFLEHVFIGSALDHMLRESRVPIFVCQ